MDGMDIDDYSRDRSRSPVRERSRSPPRRGSFSKESRDYSKRDSYSRRDYGYSRGGGRDRGFDRRERGGLRGGRGGRGRGDFRRGGGYSRDRDDRRDGRGDRRDGGFQASADESRNKNDRNYDNSIFIGNIPFECTYKDVEDIFRGDFDLIRADIVTSRGHSRGMATVEFSNASDVRKAIDRFDHYEYKGREIFVRQDYPPPSEKRREARERSERSGRSERGGRSDRGDRDRERDSRGDRFGSDRYGSKEKFTGATKDGFEVFVGNLPFSINWQALKDLMRKAGDVSRADVRLDSWGKSRGFGTVVFRTQEEADKAIDLFNGYELEGRRLDARLGRGSGSRGNEGGHEEGRFEEPITENRNTEFTEGATGDGEKSNTIFAGNLPFVTSVEDLYELFESIGRVSRAEIQYNAKGKPSGNAVVEYELEDNAQLAIENLHNYNYGNRELQVSYVKRLGDEDIPTTAAVAADEDVPIDEQPVNEQPVNDEIIVEEGKPQPESIAEDAMEDTPAAE